MGGEIVGRLHQAELDEAGEGFLGLAINEFEVGSTENRRSARMGVLPFFRRSGQRGESFWH